MSKVYVVVLYDSDDDLVQGVYQNKKDAEKYIATLKESNHTYCGYIIIKEFILQ